VETRARARPALSPDGVLESLTTLQEAWKNLGALDRVDAKIDQLRAEVSQFGARLARLSTGLRERGGEAESLETDPARALDELCGSLPKRSRSGQRGPPCSRQSMRRAQSWNARSVWALKRYACAPSSRPERFWPGPRSGQSSNLRALMRVAVSSSWCGRTRTRRTSCATLPGRPACQSSSRRGLVSNKSSKRCSSPGCARMCASIAERTLKRHEQEHQPPCSPVRVIASQR